MVDVTDATFETLVVERSKQVPVVVDLWATWCQPCTTLGPMLEAAVAARGGSVELAKVDVDQNPAISQAFQVQSIPAVFALRDGRVVDGFVGAQPAAEIEAFLDRIAPAPSEADLLVAAGDEASLRAALELDPGHAGAIAAMARLAIDAGRPAEALELLARVPETPDLHQLAAEARLAESQVDARGQEIAPLLEQLLDRVRDDEAARQEYLDLLDTLGPESSMATDFRKRLAARLF
jgi:putative thioredoxin